MQSTETHSGDGLDPPRKDQLRWDDRCVCVPTGAHCDPLLPSPFRLHTATARPRHQFHRQFAPISTPMCSMEEAYSAALERVGGLEAAKPKALLTLLAPQFPQLTLEVCAVQ